MKSEESRIQILLVDDSPDDREHFHQLMAGVESVEFDIDESDNASDALEMLIDGNYDCAVVDYNMPGYNGRWLVQEMFRRGIPTASIILTGGGSERIAVESLKSGTQDYLNKDEVSSATLEKSIVDSLASKTQQNDLQQRANFDTLTGVRKREHFMDALDNAISKAARFDRHFALLYLDMNNFKEINDRYGHPAGDKALQVFAAQLGLSARSYDTVARLGGDEFIVLLEELEGDGVLAAIRIAKRILEQLKATVVDVGTSRFSINASIGISLFPQSGNSKEQLIELSDMAMYVAKRSGGGYHLAEGAHSVSRIVNSDLNIVN